MKILFGTNKTFDRENEKQDGEAFITEKLPTHLQVRMDANTEEVKKNLERLNRPIFLIKLGVAFAIFTVIGRFLGKVIFNFSESPAASYVINGIVIALLLVTVVLFIAGMRLSKTILTDKKSSELTEKCRALQDECMETMGVPANAVDVELFNVDYTNKDGKIKFHSEFGCEVYNTDYKLYVENGNLTIIELPSKFSIPLESITSIKKIDEKISFYFWNKETPYNKGEFAQYKIKYNKNDSVYLIKYYYSLEINHNGEEYSLYFPPYELEAVEKLTGLKAE